LVGSFLVGEVHLFRRLVSSCGRCIRRVWLGYVLRFILASLIVDSWHLGGRRGLRWFFVGRAPLILGHRNIGRRRVGADGERLRLSWAL
jgi:hypothetical protein